MQVLPKSPLLSAIVKHFLILESDAYGMIDHRFFPDGNSGIVFHFGNPFRQRAEESPVGVIHPRSFIYGQVSKFQTFVSSGKIGMLVVVFQPYGAFSLLGIPAHELTDEVINLKDILGKAIDELEEKIFNSNNNGVRIELVESFLIRRFSNSYLSDSIITETVKLICDNNGLTPVSVLNKTLHVSERQLERKFQEAIGISPKHFSKIIKLQYLLKCMRSKSTQINLTELTYTCGYYDQAHLIREFKKTVGITPLYYLSKANRLAVNFLQLPSST